MKVPFGNLKLHYEANQQMFDVAVKRVLASGQFILGSELEKFEQDFAEFIGVRHAVGCASGTEAIYLTLAACGIATGDEVIVVSHTAVPTISAITMADATPIFVDIDEKTCLMDVSQIEKKITSRTKAILPVHLYGQMVDMDPLLKIANKHGVFVIEDVAQATGARQYGALAGSVGHLGAFSFYPSKNLGAFGDGGAVVTNDKNLCDRLLMLRNYGQSQRYYHDVVGINSRLDEIQAAILAAQLPDVPSWNERRIEIAERYTSNLQKNLKGQVQTPVLTPGSNHVYHLYVIQVEARDELKKWLETKEIQALIHYPVPAHLQKAYSFLGYKPGDLPVSEVVAGRVLSLPMFPELTDEQIDYVTNAIEAFFQNRMTQKQLPILGQNLR